jgi:hypothetical protein
MNLLRIAVSILGIALAAAIANALLIGDFLAAGAWLTSDPWGIVTLGDLYLGFALSAIVIALVERDWKALIWIAPIPFLGNVWTVIWFVFRMPRLVRITDSQERKRI